MDSLFWKLFEHTAELTGLCLMQFDGMHQQIILQIFPYFHIPKLANFEAFRQGHFSKL